MVGKGRVVPAPRQPGGEVEQAQTAQRLDQAQFAGMEVEELAVALDQLLQLGRLPRPVAGEHHPEVLDGRGHAGVVEIDQVGGVVAPKDVAGVGVAMDAQDGGADRPKNFVDGRQQVGRNNFV